MDEVSNFWPAIAVPITVKMPEPMTAPMPSAVSDNGPSVFFSRCSGSCESEMSLSMDLVAKSWEGRSVSTLKKLPHKGTRRTHEGTRGFVDLCVTFVFLRVAVPVYARFDVPRTIFLTLRFFDPR